MYENKYIFKPGFGGMGYKRMVQKVVCIKGPLIIQVSGGGGGTKNRGGGGGHVNFHVARKGVAINFDIPVGVFQ